MDPTSRNRISALYHAALAHAPEDRGGFLDEACHGDEALREEVESLLDFESSSGRFLERPAAVIAAGVATDVSGQAPLMIRQIGPYTIVAPLGVGGMGEVYRARDTKLGRDVAIKVLPPQFTADPERRARFAREARLLATLNHPHIGAIYGLEEADGLTALVLELVEGPTLADRLGRGPLPMADVLPIARQIAEALDTAHEKGIVHRDLKPANIVLQGTSGLTSDDVRAKVLDFGLAKTMSIGVAGDVTQSTPDSLDGTARGRILGTPAYMSPEQVRDQEVDKRTDIWAFGCVLYEMLTGRPAFEGDTISDIFVSVLEREPDWAALPAETPAFIRTLLERCLRKNPRKRLRDIADALIELDDRASMPDTVPSGVVIAAPEGGRHRSRERLAWIVAAALAVVSGAMALVYFRPGPVAGPLEFTMPPPDNWIFESGNPATFEISPDGQQVVAAAYAQGAPMLWVRPVASPAWRQLPGTRNARGPFWSADSQSVGFFADGKLKTVGISGSAPVILANAPETGLGQRFSGAWNREGVILFGQGANALQRVDSSGRNPTTATTLGQGETAHRWPSFLPDGQHFLYLAVSSEMGELRVGVLGAPDTTSLGPAESNVVYASGYLLLMRGGRGGRLMAQPFDPDERKFTGDPLVVAETVEGGGPSLSGQFSASATGVLGFVRALSPMAQLTWMDRAGNTVGTAGDLGYYPNLDLSLDGRRVAVSHLNPFGAPGQFDIWVIDLASAAPPSRLTSDAGFEFDPAWSPDGTRVAFNSSRIGERYSLWVRQSNGTGEDELVVKSGGNIYAPHWSADGRSLVYTEQGASTGFDLWTVPLSGDRKPEVFLQTPFNEGSGVVSPNGLWMAYESDASGRREVYVSAFPVAKEQIPISRDGGRAPRWRGDGGEIFFLGLDGRLMTARIPATSGFQASAPQPLFQTGLEANHYHPYAAARNGQRFLIPVFRDVPGSAPITVVLNWSTTVGK